MVPVVFDLDGTLIESLGSIAAAANATLADQKLPALAARDYAGFVGWGEGVFVDKLINATDLDGSKRDAHMASFIRHYKKAGTSVSLMPGAEDALRRLAARSVKLGLCTNKPRVPLEPILHATPLGQILDIVIAGDDFEKRKPDPLPLFKAIEALGSTTCLYVGDTQIDAETAKSADVPFALYTEGIRTVPIEDIPCDFAFKDFNELSDIYEQI